MKNTTHLRHLQTLTLAPSKGEVTIATSTNVFTGSIDSNFQSRGKNQVGIDTEDTSVDVLEMIKDGTYKQLFGPLGSDVQSLCLSQGQIVEFCRSHREHLQQDSYGTFFLFAVRRENEEGYDLFVATVCVYNGNLEVYVRSFALDYVWSADLRHRLVVKKQNT